MKPYKTMMKKYRGGLFSVSLLSVLTSLAMVFAGYSLSFLYTAYDHEGDNVAALLYTFFIVTGIWLLAMLCYYVSLLVKSRIQQKIKNELRGMVGSRIGSLNYTELTGKDCGNYVSWLTNDVEQMYDQFFSSLFSGIEHLATALFSLAALWLLSPYIGISAIVLFGIISVLPQLTSKRLQRVNAERSAALEVSTERYKDVIMGGSIFFLANLRSRIYERIVIASQKAEQINFNFNKTNAAVQVLISTVSIAGQVILLFISFMAAIGGDAPAGAALSVGNLAGSFFNGVGSLVQCFMTIKASNPLWEKFQYNAQKKEEDKTELYNIPEIKLKDVSFRYGDHPVIENQNYTFYAGGKYAIMGESGSGKTTLTKMILGLLPEYTGSILYGNIEQRDADLESLYNYMAYVDQQVYLFQDTVRFNITLGQDYTDEEILAAISRCKLDDYIKSLPNGLDTVILENGKNLSGGQRQRIALARALIRKVPYIILDEGTSALDQKNADIVEQSLLSNPDVTLILVTHHLTPERKAQFTQVYELE